MSSGQYRFAIMNRGSEGRLPSRASYQNSVTYAVHRGNYPNLGRSKRLAFMTLLTIRVNHQAFKLYLGVCIFLNGAEEKKTLPVLSWKLKHRNLFVCSTRL